jgi:hypothetical protein
MQAHRQLKVTEVVDLYFMRNTGVYRSIPLIRLQGKWLRLAGFAEGRQVTVCIEHGRLTLMLSEPASPTAGAADERAASDPQ